jgi:hypothetical protein
LEIGQSLPVRIVSSLSALRTDSDTAAVTRKTGKHLTSTGIKQIPATPGDDDDAASADDTDDDAAPDDDDDDDAAAADDDDDDDAAAADDDDDDDAAAANDDDDDSDDELVAPEALAFQYKYEVSVLSLCLLSIYSWAIGSQDRQPELSWVG